MKIPINNKPLFWQGGGSFVPEGPFELVSGELAQNPVKWDSRETWAARIIVGFKREGKRPVSMNQLVKLVRKIRLEQVGDPGSSFLSQRGLFRHDSGKMVDEPGAQVVIINVEQVLPDGTKVPVSPEEFEKQMEVLSEDVATLFEQESVIVEIQKNGINQRTFGMGRQ